MTETLNFVLTNRIPRHALTRLMGWFSKIEQPLVSRLALSAWDAFAELHLEEARKASFSSLHDCFTRELKPGMRPFAAQPDVLASPCDAIVGSCGNAQGTTVFQVKGLAYALEELLGDEQLAAAYGNGAYATLRITSSMYHRFHAPHDGRVTEVRYFSGDVWNVNPPALRRVARLFCRNERALLRMRLDAGAEILLVPVAAILVASIRLHCLDVPLHLSYRGPDVVPCTARYRKGDEMGWFEHGSTILVFAPAGFRLRVREGERIRAGEPLMQLP